jgi:hypothetical protein
MRIPQAVVSRLGWREGVSLVGTTDESGELKVLAIRNAVRSLRGCSARPAGGLPTSSSKNDDETPSMGSVVLDASALLVSLNNDPDAEYVERVVVESGAGLSEPATHISITPLVKRIRFIVTTTWSSPQSLSPCGATNASHEFGAFIAIGGGVLVVGSPGTRIAGAPCRRSFPAVAAPGPTGFAYAMPRAARSSPPPWPIPE